ncbi:MAG: hypothetical protein ABOK23_08360 [Candidatus Methanoperedens sp.]|nr:hypothetical protein [Candidatus Methanoperedens sp.]MCZ7396378.1 hypothetical protein [Candidatus Methanoperedens sp.]
MSIKIVICFIIIGILPIASASTTDNVWVAKNSGFIKSNQSISFENYLIKSQTLDNTKAAVTVYRGGNPIETREFYVNDFNKYDTIGITLLGIKGDYSWIAISKPENENIWSPLAKTVLKWGEAYSIENYTFNIDTLGSDSVNLIVSNNSMTETNAFSNNGSKDYGDLRFVVRDINRTGSIELEFFTNKAPAIQAEVVTDKNEYFPDETIPVTIKIASDAAQNIVGVTLQSNLNAEILPDSFAATGFNGTQSFHSQITKLPADSTLTVTAKIETRDYYNNAQVITASKDVFITPELSVIKRAPTDTDDENVTVELYVHNSGSNNKSIHVHDSVPDELAAKKLDWDVELGPKNSTTITYYVTPQRPGLYFLPAATAQWDGGSSTSKKVGMTMHMPYISMTKTAVNNGSQTEVKLVISNTGDRKASVSVSDNIPDGYPVASGITTMSGFVDGGGSATITYSLKGNIEKLPAADATYRDIRGVVRQAQSNIVEPGAKGINANMEKKEEASTLNSGQYEIMSFMITSFIAIAGIIAGAALIVYLLATVKRRK